MFRFITIISLSRCSTLQQQQRQSPKKLKKLLNNYLTKLNTNTSTFNQIRQVENYLTMMFNRILSTNQILLQQLKKRLTKLDLNISTNQIHLCTTNAKKELFDNEVRLNYFNPPNSSATNEKSFDKIRFKYFNQPSPSAKTVENEKISNQPNLKSFDKAKLHYFSKLH